MDMIAEKKILFISSGTSLTGVPVFFGKMIAWMKDNSDFSLTILTSGNGPLNAEYNNITTTYNWDDWFEQKWYDKVYLIRGIRKILRNVLGQKAYTYREHIIKNLKREKFDLVYVNSVSSIPIFIEISKYIHSKAILHIHELQIAIQQFCGGHLLKKLLPGFSSIITISNAVTANIIENYNFTEDRLSLVYTFTDALSAANIDIGTTKNKIRKELDIPSDAIVIGSGGSTDWRKGVDLLIHIVKRSKSLYKGGIYFIWIGGSSHGLEHEKLVFDFNKTGLSDTVRFVGEKTNPLDYFAAIDIFMLCSREEPVGMVALEAASLKKPILCFDQSGGMPEFIENDCGFIIPYLDIEIMAEKIILLAKDEELRSQLGENAATKVKRHDINIACTKILGIIEENLT
jgi:glycosyltransferase involved in cell wall biosynthesis